MAAPVLQLPAAFSSTHDTAGLAGFPAVDVSGPAGAQVLAPATGKVLYSHFIGWDTVKRVGGWTAYLISETGVYFLTHLGNVVPSGTTVRKGQVIGTVGAVPGGAWDPHVHEGLNPDVEQAVAGIPGAKDAILGGAFDKLPGIKQIMGAADAVTGAGQAVGDAVGDAVSATVSTAKFLGRLSDPNYILRALQIVAGGALVFAALYLLARQIALGAIAEAVPVPGGAKRELDDAYRAGERQAELGRAKQAGRRGGSSGGGESERSRAAAATQARRDRARADADLIGDDIPY